MVPGAAPGRLGRPLAVGRPERSESRHPDRQSRWTALDGLKPQKPAAELNHSDSRPQACYRRLAQPVKIERLSEGRLDLRALQEGEVEVLAWHPVERRAGSWWDKPYDRAYQWVELKDGRLYRLYQEKRQGHWLVEGWID